VVAIEDAAKQEGLGWLPKPLGTILEEREFGKWVVGYDSTDAFRNGQLDCGDKWSTNIWRRPDNKHRRILAKVQRTNGKDVAAY